MAKDLQLTAVLVDKISPAIAKMVAEIENAGAKMAKADQQRLARADQNGRAQVDTVDKWEKQKIQLQINSARLADKQERDRARDQLRTLNQLGAQSKTHSEVTLKTERLAALEMAKLTTDRFDRMLQVQRVKHLQILQDLKGNLAAQAAEVQRFQAISQRIDMDRGNFSNTPFQKMLKNFDQLNNKLGATGPALGVVAGSFGNAGAATGAFGSALSLLSLGPMGIAIAGLGGLAAAIKLVIGQQEESVKRMQALPKEFQDPAKVQELLKIRERYEAGVRRGARTTLTADAQAAAREFKERTGREVTDQAAISTKVLQSQLTALNKIKDYKAQHSEDVISIQRQTAEVSISTMEDEFERARAMEQARYEEDLQKFKTGSKEREAAEKLHLAQLRRIKIEEALATEFAEAELQANLSADREARRAEIANKVNAYEEKMKQEGFQAKEQEFREDVNRRQRDAAHTKAMELMKQDLKRQTVLSALHGISAMLGRGKAAFLFDKGVAAAEVALNTAVNITKYPLLMPYYLALGATQEAVIAATAIKGGYQHGTDWSPGGRFRVGERGPEEVTLPKGSKVTPAGQGGGGMVIHAPINIVISGTATPSAIRETDDMLQGRLKGLAKDIKEIEYRGIRA